MLNRYFSSTAKNKTTTDIIQSRFESTREFKELVFMLEILRKKENQLKKDADRYGIGTIHFQKHSIFKSILCEIESAVDEFNLSEQEVNSDKWMCVNFAKDLSAKIADLIKNDILSTQRSKVKENTRFALRISSVGALVAGWSTVSLLGGLGAKLAAEVGIVGVESLFQIDDQTQSYKVLNAFYNKLNQIASNLEEDVKINQEKMEIARSKIEKKRAAYVLNHPETKMSDLPMEIKLQILSFFNLNNKITNYDKSIISAEHHGIVRHSMAG